MVFVKPDGDPAVLRERLEHPSRDQANQKDESRQNSFNAITSASCLVFGEAKFSVGERAMFYPPVCEPRGRDLSRCLTMRPVDTTEMMANRSRSLERKKMALFCEFQTHKHPL